MPAAITFRAIAQLMVDGSAEQSLSRRAPRDAVAWSPVFGNAPDFVRETAVTFTSVVAYLS
jgi:hypothetical protein